MMAYTGIALLCGIIFSVGLLDHISLGFNLDLMSPIIHTGPVDSEFGFSVELHREGSTEWLLVGAPRAQTAQPNVIEGGAVYRCPVAPLSNPGDCEEIVFDSTGHPMANGIQTGSKSNQMFGYTVKSAGPNKPVVACAPLRLWYTDEGHYRFPVGGCYIARNDFTDIEEKKPCETTDTNMLKRIGPVYCEAGMSAAITEDVVVMGGPGSIYWQGGLYVDYFSSSTLDPPPFDDSQSLDDSYRGYSVTFGNFDRFDGLDIAVGLPRAPSHKGQVKLYSIAPPSLTAIGATNAFEGEQVGCYFGNSLAATDIDGNGFDDLIIGAPMYINEEKSPEGWEAGMVYVYYQAEGNNFQSIAKERLAGLKKQARFGFSVAAIGDMDKDGYNDFAVGAPYDGDDMMGAVYIYHGRRTGVRLTPAQVVHPIDFGSSLSTFGYSLASGRDSDGNAYNDLLIGAYNSSAVVLLRARPVVDVTVRYEIDPMSIDLDVQQEQRDGNLGSGFIIRTCLSFSGRDVPDFIDLAFTLTLDSQQTRSPRAVFLDHGGNKISNQVRLERDRDNCFEGDAYVKNNIRDKKNPIGVNLDYSIPVNETTMRPGQIAPILNDNTLAYKYHAIPVINDCKNFHCLPDLQLNASTTTTELVIGGDESVMIDIVVANDGEDAFEAKFFALFPLGLQFVRVERKSSDVSVTCNEDAENSRLDCDLGNPFPEAHQVEFGIKLDNVGLIGDTDEVNITMNVLSASTELDNTTADNFAGMVVAVMVEAKVEFTVSVSDPMIYEIPEEETEESNEDNEVDKEITQEGDAGPLITHIYMLQNTGRSNLGPTSVEIQWPAKTADDEYLLYLVSATMATTGESCEVTGGGSFNPEGLTPVPELARANETGQVIAALQGAQASQNDRNRRQVAEEQTAAELFSPFLRIDCDESPNNCYTIKCVTSGLIAGNPQLDRETIIIRSRLWKETAVKLTEIELTITSSGTAQVQSMPYAIAPDDLPSAMATVTTQVVPERLAPIPATAIPIWVYVVATMVGVFILCVIVLGLWKIGFFKRKKIQPNQRQMVSDDTWVEDVLKPSDKKN